MTASDVLAQERWRYIPFMIFWGIYILIYGLIKYVCYRKKPAASRVAKTTFVSKRRMKTKRTARK